MSRAARRSVRSEAYPDLRAKQNMMQLTEELTSTENKIAFARQAGARLFRVLPRWFYPPPW